MSAPIYIKMEQTCLTFLYNYVPDARLHTSFFDAVKSGVVLCKLVNAIVPGAISKIDERKNPFVYGANHQQFLNYLASINIPKCVHYTTQNLVQGNENAVSNCISCIVAFANAHKIELDSKPVDKKKLEGEGVFGNFEEIQREQEEIKRKQAELLEQQKAQQQKEDELNAKEYEAQRQLYDKMHAELEAQKRQLAQKEEELRTQEREQREREENLLKEQQELERKAQEEEKRIQAEAQRAREEAERIKQEELQKIELERQLAEQEIARKREEAEYLRLYEEQRAREAAEKQQQEAAEKQYEAEKLERYKAKIEKAEYEQKQRYEQLERERAEEKERQRVQAEREQQLASEAEQNRVHEYYALLEKLEQEKIARQEQERAQKLAYEQREAERQAVEQQEEELESNVQDSQQQNQSAEQEPDILRKFNQTNSTRSDEPFDEQIKNIAFKEAPPRQIGEDSPDKIYFEPPSRFLKTYKCNVAVIGASQVGKASVCQRFYTGEFDPDFKRCEFYFRKFQHTVNEQPANVELTLKITEDAKYVKQCYFVFVVFAHNDVKSFKNVSKYIKLAEKSKVEDIIVIGNKADEKQGGVSIEEIQKFTEKLKKHSPKIKYVSTSCVKGFGIKQLIESLDFRTSSQ